jgi:hypothetical protein
MSTTPPPPPGTPPPTPPGGFGAPPPNPGFGDSPPPTDLTFWKKLFELDFRHFVTPSVVKVLYVLWIIVASIYGLFFLIAGLASLGSDDGGGAGIILAILAPVVWFLFVVYGRVIIEVFIALIRTAQNTTILVDRSGGDTRPPQSF